MKRLMIVLALLFFAMHSFAAEQVRKIPAHGSGSSLLGSSSTELTDAAATYNAVVLTHGFQDIVVDVVSDKGGTLTITPLPDIDDETTLGQVSDTLTVADGGESSRAAYSKIAAPKAKVLFTKTEAGTTSGFFVAVRGTLD